MDSPAMLRVDITSIYGMFYGPYWSCSQDPCPFGLPDVLTVAHMLLVFGLNSRDSGRDP